MATRRRELTDERDPVARIIDAEAEDVSQMADDDRAEEDDIASEFGAAEGDVVRTLKVHKYIPNSKDTIFCMNGTAADLPIVPKLQEGWGEGKYKVTMYRDGKIARRWTVLVGPLPAWRNEKPAPAQAPGVNDPRIMALLERALEPKGETQNVFAGWTPDKIIAAIGAGAGVIAAIQPLLPKQTNQLEMLKVAMELVNGMRPEYEGREPGIWDTIGKVLTNPDLMGTLASLAPGAAQPGTPQPQSRQLPSPQAPRNPPTPEQIQQAQMQQMVGQLAFLVTRAQKNSDPALYADVIVDSLEESLVQRLAAPGAIDFIIALHPPCATYKPWFEALLTALAEPAYEDETGPESEPEPLHNGAREAHSVSGTGPTHTVTFDPRGERGNEGDAYSHGGYNAQE